MTDHEPGETSHPRSDPPRGVVRLRRILSAPWLRRGRNRSLLALVAVCALVVPLANISAAPQARACLSVACTSFPTKQPVDPTVLPTTLSHSPPATLSPPTQPIVVSVVGDSAASGEGTGGYLPENSGDSSLWRHVSPYAPSALAFLYLETSNKPATGSYPVSDGSMMHAWLGDQLYFGASSGATTGEVYNSQIDSDTGKFRNVAQLNYVAPNSNVVFFQLGGNDVGFGHVMATAVMSYLSDLVRAFLRNLAGPFGSSPVDWETDQAQNVGSIIALEEAKLPTMQESIVGALLNIQDKATAAHLVVSLYPVGMKSSGNTTVPMVSGMTQDELYGFLQQVNAGIRSAVARYNTLNPTKTALIFDPNSAGPGGSSLVAGHELSSASPYYNGVEFNASEMLLNHTLHAFQESFHPNRAGDIAIGQGLATWLQSKFPQLWPTVPTFYQVTTQPQTIVPPPTPGQLWPSVGTALSAFCTYTANQRLAGCTPGTGAGGSTPGTPGTYPGPDSPGYDLWLIGLVSGGSGENSSDGTNGGTTAPRFQPDRGRGLALLRTPVELCLERHLVGHGRVGRRPHRQPVHDVRAGGAAQ